MEALISLFLFAVAGCLFLFAAMWLFGNSSLGQSSGWTFWKMIRVIVNPSSLKDKSEGADFLNQQETKKFLNHKNEGLLIDGHTSRLSREDSFTHCLLTAPPGMGKSTKMIIPNILAFAHTKNTSMVITDPSGELFEKTSGILAQRGFDVQVISPADPHKSMAYNPLANINALTDIDEMAKTLVASVGGTKDDSFWQSGAEDLIKIIMRILGLADHKKYLNLPNVLYLLQNMGERGEGLDAIIAKYGRDSEVNTWKGITSQNEKALQSFVTTALQSLSMLQNPVIGQMMGHNEVDFKQLRKKPTALFLIIPSEKLEYYKFILNMLYTDLFNTLMSERPDQIRARGEQCNSVYCLMDEAGHTNIPSMGRVLSTIRKYECSITLILQSLAQLDDAYGKEADIIIEGGITHKLFMGGVANKTAKTVEELLGKKVITEIRKDGSEQTKETSLMNADRVRVMKGNELLMISGNREPVMMKTKAYYEQPKMVAMSKIPPLPIGRSKPHPKVEYLKLD